MEIFFDMIKFFIEMIQFFILGYILSRNVILSKKIDKIISDQKKLAGDLGGIEKSIVILSQKIDSTPNVIQEDIHRFMLTLRDSLEAAKPIKSNNWDSVKEAFKGPVRIDVNERN